MKIFKPTKPLTPTARIKEAETQAELDRLAFQREQEEAERASWRAARVVQTRAERAKVDTARYQALGRRVIPYLPLILVNTLAVIGQLGWGRSNLDGGLIVAVLFASTLESIALFLQYYGNRALRRRDSANGLFMAAFLVAGVVAWINYSHYAGPDHAPTATAVAFALCSMASPWLWRIHSRAENRDELVAAGEIDPRAVKLSMARKVYHPVRSFKVVRMAAWTGETNPGRAVADWERMTALKVEAKRLEADRKAAKHTEKAVEAPAGTKALEAPRTPRKPSQGQSEAKKAPAWERFPAVWTEFVETDRAGNPLSQRALAAKLGGNRHHARAMVQHLEEIKGGSSVNGSRPATVQP